MATAHRVLGLKQSADGFLEPYALLILHYNHMENVILKRTL